jgi:hypothetical protein
MAREFGTAEFSAESRRRLEPLMEAGTTIDRATQAPAIDIPPIIEKIVRTDVLSLVLNQEPFLRTGKRIVDLACGHKTLTGAANRAACPRCREMLVRSLNGGGEDYDGFRHGNSPDRMVWPADPLRHEHEPEWLVERTIQAEETARDPEP